MKPRADIQLFLLPIPEQISPEVEARGLSLMSHAELARYDNMGSAKRRRQFLLGHTLVRSVVSWHCEINLFDVPVFFEGGRPVLGMMAGKQYYLSLSHNQEYVTCALAESPVGVDIESIRERRFMESIIQRIAGERDLTEFSHLSASDRLIYFFRLWTLREAVFKAFASRAVQPETYWQTHFVDEAKKIMITLVAQTSATEMVRAA